MDPQNLEDMNDDQLEAAQRAADGESPGTDPVVDTDPAAKDPADAGAEGADGGTATPDAAAQGAGAKGEPGAATEDPAAGASADTGKVDGIASKDGTRVLPYGALQAERRSRRQAESRYEEATRELEEAKQQIADLKAGKVPETPITEAEVAEMEENFPEQGKKFRALFEAAQAATKATPAAAAPAEPGDDPVQEAVDQVPLLLEWQTGDADKFARAVEHDAVLAKSPKWQGKPAVERFTEAARRTADEFDIAFPEPTPSKTPTSPTAAARAAAAAAPRAAPNSLSDFKGGAVADHGTEAFQKMPAQQMLGRFLDMTDDEIDAQLAKNG